MAPAKFPRATSPPSKWVHIWSPPRTVQSSRFQPWSSHPAGALGYFPARGRPSEALTLPPSAFQAAWEGTEGPVPASGGGGKEGRTRPGGAPDAEAGHSPRLETRSSFRAAGARKPGQQPHAHRPDRPHPTLPAALRPRPGHHARPRLTPPARVPPRSLPAPAVTWRATRRRNRTAGRGPRLSERGAPGASAGIGVRPPPPCVPRAPPPRCSPFWARFGRRRSRPPRPRTWCAWTRPARCGPCGPSGGAPASGELRAGTPRSRRPN